jgi:2-hydroxycyclohexanecarboxyl-CoA dehydrogenase
MTGPRISLEGNVAVVTGGGSGIGRAVSLRLAELGCVVAAVDRDVAGAEETVKLVEGGTKGQIKSFEVDVTNNDDVLKVAEEIIASIGTPTIIVNAAGIDKIEPFIDNETALWEKLVDVNFLGVVRVCRAFLPAMTEAQRGTFINIASDAGRVGSTGEVVYSGTKGGVIAFTKALAREVARYNIRANSVCPGPTETPMFFSQSEKIREALARATPMRRVAQPEEIADAVYFFASDLSQFVTGQVLSVSGGLTMAG